MTTSAEETAVDLRWVAVHAGREDAVYPPRGVSGVSTRLYEPGVAALGGAWSPPG